MTKKLKIILLIFVLCLIGTGVFLADSITDTFTDESKIASKSNITVTGGQVMLSTCEDNGTACTLAEECCSNYCVDNVCCNNSCSGSTCQTCGTYSSGGAGTCGYVNDSGQDPDGECTTASPPNADSCKSATCSGTDYTCGYLAAGEQSQPTCKRCNGSSYDPVNVTDDTGDSEGSNLCNASSGDCYRCSSGSCTYQTAAQDLFSECPGALGTCASTTCSGSGYACGYLTVGQQGCSTCQYCTGASYSCTNVTNGLDPYGNCPGAFGTCAGSNCNGSGSCQYLTGQQSCSTCKYCTGASYSCTNVTNGLDPYGNCPGAFGTCAGSNCNGSGSCQYLTGQQSCSTCYYCTGASYSCQAATTYCGAELYGCTGQVSTGCSVGWFRDKMCSSGSCISSPCPCL